MLLVSILRPILLAQLKILSHVMVVPRMVQISPTDTDLTIHWTLNAPSPESQRLRAHKQLKTTGGVPHANYQLLVAVHLCRTRPSNLLVIQMRQTETQGGAVFWEPFGAPLPPKTPLSAIVSIQNSLASFPRDYLCRTLTRRSYLATRKTSHPYGVVFQLG